MINLELTKELNDIYNTIQKLENEIAPKNENKLGISIIIPIYDGIDYLEKCLESLLKQNVKNANFEVILVFNGKFKNDINFLYANYEKYNYLDLVILINDIGNASAARNLGLKYAKYSHITYLDIDDYLSPNYIEASFKYLDNQTVIFSQIHDVIDGEVFNDNSVNIQIINNVDKENVEYFDINRILTITVCKVIPKQMLWNIQFRENLKSGEDTVFYSELFVNQKPMIKIIPLEEEAIYYRIVRENSVSRKGNTFEFLINERLDILHILDDFIHQIRNKNMIRVVMSKYNAQIVFMNKYLKENPQDYPKVIKLIKDNNFKHFNFSILNRGLAETLYLTYCFPPFVDTSATVVMKRILERKEIIDVVSNNLSTIRDKDYELSKVINPYIGRNIVNNSKASFSSMYYLSSYIDKAFETYLMNPEGYKNIYSRAMFPISHVPGLFIKALNKNVKWTAEFSDPLLFDIESRIRFSEINNEGILKSVYGGVLGEFTKYVDNNLFNLAELIPFALADEIIFTNVNQLEYMIMRFDDDHRDIIRNKAKIEKHVTLPLKYYEIDNFEYIMNSSLHNIAYFGNFYSNRGVDEFITIIRQLNRYNTHKFKLHIFTNLNGLNGDIIEKLKKENIVLNNYVPYFVFLRMTKEFDLLLLMDTKTQGVKQFNPYLPSKLSDYLGSGSKILALYEDTSILSKLTDKNLYKLNIEDVYEKKYLSSRMRDIGKFAKHNREFYIENNIHGSRINEKSFSLKTSKYLRINPSDDWLISIYDKEISINHNYDFNYTNKNNVEKKIFIKGFYSLKNIINIEITSTKTGEVRLFDISQLTDFTEINVRAHDNIMVKFIYNQSYKNKGFVRAGRVILKLT